MATFTENIDDFIPNFDDTTAPLAGVEGRSDTLGLSDSVSDNIAPISVSDTLNLTDQVDDGSSQDSASDTLNLTDSVQETTSTSLGVTDYLQFVDDEAPIFDPATFELVFEKITGGYWDAQTRNFLFPGVADPLPYTGPLTGEVRFPAVGFYDSVSLGGVSEVVTDNLILTDDPFPGHIIQRNDVVILSDTVADDVRLPLTDNLTLSDNITTVQYHAPDDVQDTLDLDCAVAYVYTPAQQDSCLQTAYAPTIGTEAFPESYMDPVSTPAINGVQLQFPAFGTTTNEMVLRAPNLGNRDRLAFNRVNTLTRGGTLRIFADPIWTKIQTLVLQFSGLKREEAEGLLDFIYATLGQQIRIIDWESRLWIGVITRPDDAIIEDTRGRYTASFEFEGEVVDPALLAAGTFDFTFDGTFE